MRVDNQSVTWAEDLIVDPVSGRPNRDSPPPEVRSSGINRNEAFPRQWINDLFYQHGEALKGLQDQIDNADIGAGLISYSTVQDMVDNFGASTATRCVTYAYNRPVVSFWERVSSGAGDMSDGTLSLGNNLYAKLQILPEMDVRAFGAYGNHDPLSETYVNDDSAAINNAIKNCSKVTCTEGDCFAIADHIDCSYDSKLIDFRQGKFFWFGVAGAIRAVGRDRAMFEINGTFGDKIQESGVWSQWLEGAETFPSPDTVPILSKEFILLAVGALPNGPSEAYMVRPMGVRETISDPDTRFQTDYRLGWTHTDATFRYFDVNPVKNVTLLVGHVEDKTTFDYFEEDGSGNKKTASAVVMEAAWNCHVKINTSKNFQYPTVMTYYTTDCSVRDIFLLPSERDSAATEGGQVIDGWGIAVQWNNALRPYSFNLRAQGNRRVFDYTQAAYALAEQCGGESTRDGEMTTHGSYEHNLTYINTRGFMSFANSGVAFGESTKDITVKHHHGSDIFAVTNVINLSLEDVRCNSIRVNSVGLRMNNCSLYDLQTSVDNLCQINNWSERIGKPYPQDRRNAVISNSNLGSNGVVYLVDQDIGADDLITFDNCDLELRQGDFAGPANIVIKGGTIRPKNGTGQLVLVANPTSVRIEDSDLLNVGFGVLDDITSTVNFSIKGGKVRGENFSSAFWANQDGSNVTGNKFEMDNVEVEWDNTTDTGFIYDPLGTRNSNWYNKIVDCDITGTGAGLSNLRLPLQRFPMRFGNNTLKNIIKDIDVGETGNPASRIEYNTIAL